MSKNHNVPQPDDGLMGTTPSAYDPAGPIFADGLTANGIGGRSAPFPGVNFDQRGEYKRLRRLYIARHLDTDLALARRGEDPSAARRVIQFALAEHDHGYTPPPVVLAHFVESSKRALEQHSVEMAAWERSRVKNESGLPGVPGVGTKRPVLDLNKTFGLRYARRGNHTVPDDRPVEIARDALTAMMVGSKTRDDLVSAATLEHDLSAETINGYIKDAWDAFMVEMGLPLLAAVRERLTQDDIDQWFSGNDQPPAILDASKSVIAEDAQATGRSEVALWRAYRRVIEVLCLPKIDEGGRRERPTPQATRTPLDEYWGSPVATRHPVSPMDGLPRRR